jgi:hypothetical protein
LRPHRRGRVGAPHAAIRALLLGIVLSVTVTSAAAAPAIAAVALPGAAAPSAPPAGAAAPRARPHHAVRRRALVVRRARYETHAGGAIAVRGTLLPRARRRIVVLEAALGGRWRPVAHARTRANGHFRIPLGVSWVGSGRLRVRAAGGVRADVGVVRSYRPTVASWYSLYGSPLACGGTLRYEQLGVANKTLPCGTKVTLRYRGRVVTVPVIDRGPYVGGREWDLTGATARRLGFDGVGVVWSTR